MDNNIAIVLTGTIIPSTTLFLEHTNPKLRKDEYLKSIDYYKKFAPVYFLENSDYPLLNDRDFLERDVFLRKFEKSKYSDKGKGFMEFEMLSNWIGSEKNLPKNFIKITGRYIIKNFESIFNDCMREKNYLLIIDQLKRTTAAFSQLFFIETSIFKNYFMDTYIEADDNTGRYIEFVFFEKIIKSGVDFRIFFNEPIYSYISGTNMSIVDGDNLKCKIKNVLRKFNYFFDKKYLYFR